MSTSYFVGYSFSGDYKKEVNISND